MKQLGLHSTWQRKPPYRKATQPHLAIENALSRPFDTKRPDQVWCSDVTYIWAGRHGSNRAVVFDLYARKPVGWVRSGSADSKRTAKALSLAYQSQWKPRRLLFLCDQGSHYTSRDFRQHLWRDRMEPSMSRRGNCWDNAPMELF